MPAAPDANADRNIDCAQDAEQSTEQQLLTDRASQAGLHGERQGEGQAGRQLLCQSQWQLCISSSG